MYSIQTFLHRFWRCGAELQFPLGAQSFSSISPSPPLRVLYKEQWPKNVKRLAAHAFSLTLDHRPFDIKISSFNIHTYHFGADTRTDLARCQGTLASTQPGVLPGEVPLSSFMFLSLALVLLAEPHSVGIGGGGLMCAKGTSIEKTQQTYPQKIGACLRLLQTWLS